MPEKYKPRPKSAHYLRIRKYIGRKGKTKKYAYIAYLGREDGQVPSIQSVKSEFHEMDEELKQLQKAGGTDDVLRKKIVYKRAFIEELEAQEFEARKGGKLTKLERELVGKEGINTYQDMVDYLNKWIDKRYLPNEYGARHGIHKITKDLNDLNVNVSHAAVQKYIKDKGIWEKREFGRPKKIDVDVEKLVDNMESLLREIEVLERHSVSSEVLRGTNVEYKKEERENVAKNIKRRREEYGTIPLKEP